MTVRTVRAHTRERVTVVAMALVLGCGKKDAASSPAPSVGPVATTSVAPSATTPNGRAKSSSAIAKNDAGFAAYKAGRFEEAEEMFLAATEDDPSFALAHFNLACTRGRLHAKDRCRATRDAILEPLRRAVELAPEKRARFLADADLTPVRSTVAFRLLSGASLSRVDDMKAILTAIEWNGPTGPGVSAALGPLSGMSFRADGTALRWTRTLRVEGVGESSPLGPRRTETGSYTLPSAGAVAITWRGRPSETWRLHPDGTLALEGGGTGDVYRDAPPDCDL